MSFERSIADAFQVVFDEIHNLRTHSLVHWILIFILYVDLLRRWYARAHYESKETKEES